MNEKEIKSEIKRLKAEMKARNVRVVSCFNGGLTSDERYYNTYLFDLKSRLILVKGKE